MIITKKATNLYVIESGGREYLSFGTNEEARRFIEYYKFREKEKLQNRLNAEAQMYAERNQLHKKLQIEKLKKERKNKLIKIFGNEDSK